MPPGDTSPGAGFEERGDLNQFLRYIHRYDSYARRSRRSKLSKFSAVLQRDRMDRLWSELLWRLARAGASGAKEAVQEGRCRDPEQEQFVVGILKCVPCVLRNEDCRAFLERVTHIVETEDSVAFQNIEDFVHMKMPMNGNS
jgi:hypothetical protein